MKAAFRNVLAVALLSLGLAALAVGCDSAFGEFSSPLDSKSSNYPGYPTVANPDEIAAAKAADLSDGVNVKLTVTKVAGATSYNAQISTSSAFAAADILVDPTEARNAFAVAIGNLKVGTLFWRVRAQKGGSWGKWSPTASFALGSTTTTTTTISSSASAAPTNLVATAGEGQVTLSWTASSGATSYNVYYQSGASAATTGVTKAPATAVSGTTATIAGLSNGTMYAFVVTAVFPAGESGWSATKTATPLAAVAIPSAPTGLTATGGPGKVTLAWIASSGASSYNVYYRAGSTTPTKSDTKAPSSAISGTTATVSGLTVGVAYMFVVSAVNSVGESAVSGQNTAIPTAVTATMEMVAVAGGTFTQSRQVTLSDYAIGKYEVTFDQYDAFCSETDRSQVTDAGFGRGSRPVIMVTWYDAVAFCNWLSAKEGLQAAYTGSGTTWTMDRTRNGYRLPTEAEWEYAASGRASISNYTFAGSNNIDNVGWIQSNTIDATHTQGQSMPVGGKLPNELGIYDMSGNVWEWNNDWYQLAYPSVDEIDPLGPTTGTTRVARGGGYLDAGSTCGVTIRGGTSPAQTHGHYGFRVARTPAYVVVSGLTLDQSTLSLTAGGAAATLVATVAPSNASVKGVTWTSSAPTIASVSSAGLVTPLNAGTATITARSVYDAAFAASCTVTVLPNGSIGGTITINPATPGSVVLSGPTTLSLAGASVTYSATVSVTVAVGSPYQWFIDNAGVGNASTLPVTPSSLTFGPHLISLFVRDNKGLVHSGSLAVTVTN